MGIWEGTAFHLTILLHFNIWNWKPHRNYHICSLVSEWKMLLLLLLPSLLEWRFVIKIWECACGWVVRSRYGLSQCNTAFQRRHYCSKSLTAVRSRKEFCKALTESSRKLSSDQIQLSLMTWDMLQLRHLYQDLFILVQQWKG